MRRSHGDGAMAADPDAGEVVGRLRGHWPDGLVSALTPLLELLADDNVTEIEANGYDDVWIKGNAWWGHRRAKDVQWFDRADFEIACVRISDVIGRSVSRRAPLLNARLPGGERVNIAIAPACERIALTIRKFPAETMTFDVLEEKGSVNRSVRQICENLVATRQSILVAGGTGAGKTSLLNALSRVIPAHERIITIEDARELQIQQPNWVAMETVEPYEAGATPVTIGDLVRNALRQTPDRIIVGEVRGEEAFFLVRALSTGHGGGFGTIHSNDAEDGLHQLQLLAQMAPVSGLTFQMVASMVARAVNVVIYQRHFEDENARRVAEILEIERPGVSVGTGGDIAYRFRRLVGWDSDAKDWEFPSEPSERLRRALVLKGLAWPDTMGRSILDERTEPDAMGQ
jgi:pilus assembly protein CpaF